jgi:protoheme IX farnesyltransferase
MAIAWMYRDDYDRAGYRVLPGSKNRRMFAALHAAIPAALLIPLSFVPWIGREVGSAYALGTIVLGLGFAWPAFRFGLKATNVAARQLLFASILYLPTVFILLLLDRR